MAYFGHSVDEPAGHHHHHCVRPFSISGEVNNNFLVIYASSYIPACVEGLSTIRASAANYEWWYWDSATPRSDPTADPINTTLHRLQSLSKTKEVTPKSQVNKYFFSILTYRMTLIAVFSW